MPEGPVFFQVPDHSPRLNGVVPERELSLEISVVLFVIYLLSLVFTLKTHRHLVTADPSDSGEDSEPERDRWSRQKAVTVLALVTVVLHR
jgi:Ca2+:H+ antiporter